MSITELILLAASCAVFGQAPSCWQTAPPASEVAGTRVAAPQLTGEALDVVLTSEAALVWDVASGAVLYEKNADEQRPIASISKLFTALLVRDNLDLDAVVPVPAEVLGAQRAGVDVALPVGDTVRVEPLLKAGLVASANDAMVALAAGIAGDEASFVEQANREASRYGLLNTQMANATGLSGGMQFSTARDVKTMLSRAYADETLRQYLSAPDGDLVTESGIRRHYVSTNQLLKTYVPIVAAKTGYTVQAKENLAIVTEGASGQRIGAIILGSDDRFQDMKVLVEWVWRNYTWPRQES